MPRTFRTTSPLEWPTTMVADIPQTYFFSRAVCQIQEQEFVRLPCRGIGSKVEEDSAVYRASTIRRLIVEDGGFEWGTVGKENCLYCYCQQRVHQIWFWLKHNQLNIVPQNLGYAREYQRPGNGKASTGGTRSINEVHNSMRARFPRIAARSSHPLPNVQHQESSHIIDLED